MHIKRWILVGAVASSALCAHEAEWLKQIGAQLCISDKRAALAACKSALAEHPDSLELKRAMIQVLGQLGQEREALKWWKAWGFAGEDRALIETVAWGVIEQSAESSQWIIPFSAMISACATQDVRVTSFLLKQLRSPHAFLREVAVQLAAHYRDAALVDELKRLLKEETVWSVRLQVIEALGAMEIQEAKEALQTLAISSRTSLREKVAAISALVAISSSIEDKEFDVLLSSPWAGLRMLACHLVAHLDWVEKTTEVVALLEDSSSDVRLAALNTLYLIGLGRLEKGERDKIQALIFDVNPFVAITASWIALRFAPQLGLRRLEKEIGGGDPAAARCAAFALAHGSKAALPMARALFQTHVDPFVRVNLALGLAKKEREKEPYCHFIHFFLTSHKQWIMWEGGANPLFEVIGPTNLCHIAEEPHYPLTVDQLTRLEVLTALAKLSDKRAQAAMRAFLAKPLLGITYAAASALIEQGGEDILVILRALLHDDDKVIRVQAALVLALSWREDEAIHTLQQAYFTMDRAFKVNILHALGYIGSERSVSFLLARLQEPYEVVKVAAAAALIQCLYH